MEILKDKALVLKRKNVNDNNMNVVLFTQKYGKINSIAYGIRSANKKEKISLNPISLISVELKKTNESYVISNYHMEKCYNNIYKSLEKMELAIYLVDLINKLLEYSMPEESIFTRVENILVYINDIENEKLKNEEFRYSILVSSLKKIIYDLGIYDTSICLNSTVYKNLQSLEKYINNYFNININYNKIMW